MGSRRESSPWVLAAGSRCGFSPRVLAEGSRCGFSTRGVCGTWSRSWTWSRTWSRRDAQDKAAVIMDLLQVLGASADDVYAEDYVDFGG